MNKHIQNIKEQGYTILPQSFNKWQVDYLLMLVKKYYEGPVFIGDGGNWVGTVEVKKHKEGFSMLYSSCKWKNMGGYIEPVYDIKQAISYDGLVWLPTLKTYIGLEENEGGIAACRETKDFRYYCSRKERDYRTNPKNSYKIYSHKFGSVEEILELSPEGDEIMCAYPFVVEEEDKYIMFYNSDFGKSGISYSIKMK